MSQNRKQIRLLPVDTIDKTFKEYAKTISQSIQKLGAFTDNLESKVNTLLKAQQTEFVTSYKIHMGKIKTQLQEMDKKICQYQQKIQFYQNQGRLSHYIKKVNFMELEQIKLFQQIETKDKKIKDLQFEIEMFKKLQKFSDDKIKTMIRNKVQERQKSSQIEQQKQSLQNQYSQSNLSVNHAHMKQMSSIQTFATQIPSYSYNRRGRANITSLKGKIEQLNSKEKKQFKLITEDQQKSILYKSQNYSNIQIDQRETHMSPEMKSYQISVLEKEISQLKAQNKKLLLFNSKYASNLSELGQFFLKTVQELKRSVISKRKLKENTTFADFCKQDKLVLIATLLSNQSALMLLYDSIFKPQTNKKRAQSVLQKNNAKEFSIHPNQQTIQQIMMNPQKSVQHVSKAAFPSIKSKRLVY